MDAGEPLVCVEVDDVTAPDHWTSVIVLGRYEELPDTIGHEGEWLRPTQASRPDRDEGRAPRRTDDRLSAYKVLKAQAEWRQPGSSAHVDPFPAGRLAPIYYRVSIDRINGHRATPGPEMAVPPAATQREEAASQAAPFCARVVSHDERGSPYARSGAGGRAENGPGMTGALPPHGSFGPRWNGRWATSAGAPDPGQDLALLGGSTPTRQKVSCRPDRASIGRDGIRHFVDTSWGLARPQKSVERLKAGRVGKIMGLVTSYERNRMNARGPLVEDIQNYAQNIVDTVREPLLILDATLRVRSANRAFYQTFHVSPGETEGRLIYELGNGQWDIPDLRTLLEDIVPKSSVFDDFELDHTFPAIGRRVMLLNARKLQAGQHGELLVLAMGDVTERKRAEEALLKAGALQSAIFNSANFSSIATDEKGVIQIFNVGAERMLGYAAAEVMNKITPADISDPQEVIARASRAEPGTRHPDHPGLRGAGLQGLARDRGHLRVDLHPQGRQPLPGGRLGHRAARRSRARSSAIC